VCVDNVRGFGPGQKCSYLMGFFVAEADNVATAQEPPKLHLAWCPAGLGDYRRRRHWNYAHLEASTVVSPDFPVVSVRGEQ
jgi:hypothetical protein